MKALFNLPYGIKVAVLLAIATTSIDYLNAQFYKNTNVNTAVCRADYEQSDPAVVADGNGGAIVVWADKRNNSDFNLYAQKFDSKGKAMWTTDGVPVCRMSGDQVQPVIISDGNGGVMIAWIDGRSTYEIYTQKLNSSGARQWDTSGVIACTSTGNKYGLIAHTDFNGGMVLVWTDMRSDMDIISQRVDGNGNIIWESDGVEVCTETGDQSSPSICGDSDTAFVIAWEDARNGKKLLYDIYANKIALNGNIHWITNGVQVCSTQEDQLYPKVCSDDSGGAIVTWQDKRSGSNDIYIQRLDKKGASLWTANGSNICSASNDQVGPNIVKDGSGGAIVVWRDQRTSGANYLYTQHLTGAGSTIWNTNGISICSSSGSRENPNMYENGEGGAFVIWSDTRNNNYDLYIQNLNGNGTVSFTNNGLLVSIASNDQISNTVCTDESGGLLIAWTDGRNTSTGQDIYIQNVQKDGNLGIVSEISVKGNNVNISDNDNSPSIADNTDMGSTKSLSPFYKSFKILNTGNDTLKVSGITISGTNAINFAIDNITLPANVLPKDSASFDLKYTPSGIGVSNAVVNINNNDSNESVFNFAVRATFKAPKIDILGNNKIIADGDITPGKDDSTSYEQVRINTPRNRTFEISSSGTDTLSVNSITISGTNSTDFSLQSVLLPRKLNGGKTMTFTITFNPASIGFKSAKVSVTSNDPANPLYEFDISGSSVVPAIVVKYMNNIIPDESVNTSNTNGTDYGKLRKGKQLSHTFKISNSGNDQLLVDNIRIDGTGGAAYSVKGITLPTYIHAGQSLDFQVEFSPTFTGTYPATIYIDNDDPGKFEYNFNITGTGIEPLISLQGNYQTISMNDTFPSVNDGTGFGNLRVAQTKSSKFVIHNIGSDTLKIASININHQGTQGFYLSNTNTIQSILPNDSAFFNIEFKPVSRTNYKSRIEIVSDVQNAASYVFAVSGRGVDALISVSGNGMLIPKGSSTVQKQNNTDFDSVELTQSKALKYKIVNNGDYNLRVNSILLSGQDVSDFELQTLSYPQQIAPGDSLVFELTYNATTEGIKTANVQINSDDPNNSNWSFKISALGYKKITSLSSSMLLGFSVYPNPASSEIQVSVPENIQNAELSITNMVGQELSKIRPITTGIYSVNIEDLKEGLYIVSLFADGKTYKYKLVVRR